MGERTLAEYEQMCSAPASAYSAGEWCEAANDLVAALAAKEAEVERKNEAENALRELAGYVRAYLAGADADPELRWALEQADDALSSDEQEKPCEGGDPNA